MSNPEIVIVVAMAANNVIGRNGDMPWKLSTDLRRFKALTLGKPLVMGRKTFDSVGGKPLPGRPHVIVSRSAEIDAAGVETVRSLDEAIERAREIAMETGAGEICIAGGGEIYRQALPLADVLHVTHVEAEIEGDTVFPEIDPAVFEKMQEMPVPVGEKDNYPTRYAIYRRRPAA